MNFLPSHTGQDGELVSTSYKDTMQEGDLVVVYEHYNSMKAVYISAGAKFENRFGSFPHKVRQGPGP